MKDEIITEYERTRKNDSTKEEKREREYGGEIENKRGRHSEPERNKRNKTGGESKRVVEHERGRDRPRHREK